MILGPWVRKKKEGYFSGQETFCQSEVQGKESGGGEAVLSGSVKEQSKRRKRTGLLELQIQKMEVFWHRGIFFLPVTLSGPFCLSVSLIVQMRNKGEYGQFG